MHILMGDPLTPREAERKGLVHETVTGKALDRAMEIARRLSLHTPESVAYIKRLVRNATETPLAQGLALERNLFLKLCITEPALARMRSYEEKNITSPSRSFEVEEGAVTKTNHGARAGHRGNACVLEGCLRLSAFQHRGRHDVRRPPGPARSNGLQPKACVSSCLRARIPTSTLPTLI